MEARYKNADGHIKGRWVAGDLTGALNNDLWKESDLSGDASSRRFIAENLSRPYCRNNSYRYGIENPFTNKLYYPPSSRFWRISNVCAKELLNGWGVEYTINDNGDCCVKDRTNIDKAKEIQTNGPWPEIYFGKLGLTGPRYKRYRSELKNEGRVIGTYWESNEVLDEEDGVFNLSMRHEISGHNGAAKMLIKAILGGNIVFDTPKPLKLTERLIEMFCPKDGIVLDAFGGSATTAHAVLDLNNQGAERRFVIIEEANFIDDITAERIRRVINCNWAFPRKDTLPLGGSFGFYEGIE